MKNIAIFVSGKGESAERIVKLFNEGNRVRTVMVIADDSANEVLERLPKDVTLIHVPDQEWHSKGNEIASLLKEKEVKLIVLDNFDLSLSDEILEAVDGEMIRVSGPDLAPREVVNALEADLRKPAPEIPQPEIASDEPKTPEEEWAQTLNIRFTPPKVPTTPPEVPGSLDKQEADEIVDVQPLEEIPKDNSYNREFPNQFHYQGEYRHQERHKEEPMPSTWLVWSVLSTIFCCFIPGIIAIIFSSQVSSKYYAGDIEGAKRASRTAEIWIIVSVVLGIMSATLYLPFMLIGG